MKVWKKRIHATSNIDPGNHLTSFIADLRKTERYRNAIEALIAGLLLLEEQVNEYQSKPDILRLALKEGA